MVRHWHKKWISFLSACAIALGLLTPALVQASSHREAPLISRDPQADNVDSYVFVSPDDPTKVTIICTYLPLQEPAGGPNFYQFGEGMEYNMLIDNDGDAKPNVSYRFEFNTVIPNGNTFLYATGPITSLSDADYNIRQFYSVTKTVGRSSSVIAQNKAVPPNNIGPTSTPNYGSLSDAGIYNLADGVRVFAGQTDDPFFVDLGGTFDLLTIRNFPGNAGGGVDGLDGYNVLALAMQVPIAQLKSTGSPVIGVWCNAERSKITVLSDRGGAPNPIGPRVQVSRLGMPLFNEVIVPLGSKDRYNATEPEDDAQFGTFVTDPELGKFFASLGVAVPPQGPLGSPSERDDLKAIFLTGVPGLNQLPKIHLSEMIRLNTSIAPSTTPSRLGVLGGDFSGFPNGRRLADDIVDIELRAVAGAAYPLFHPTFTPPPAAGVLGDGVDANDLPFRTSFPYLALAHSGFDSVAHVGAAKDCSTVSALVDTKSIDGEEFCFVIPDAAPEGGLEKLVDDFLTFVGSVTDSIAKLFTVGDLDTKGLLGSVKEFFFPSVKEEPPAEEEASVPAALTVQEEPESLDVFGDAGIDEIEQDPAPAPAGSTDTGSAVPDDQPENIQTQPPVEESPVEDADGVSAVQTTPEVPEQGSSGEAAEQTEEEPQQTDEEAPVEDADSDI